MDKSLYITLFLAFFFLPPTIFCIVAVFAKARVFNDMDHTSLDEYLLASREISQPDYINSTAAYMLQVSTTFYFVYWGYNYGFSNIWYMLSWGLGLYAFSRFSRELIAIRHKHDTLPGYLSGGNFSPLRYVAAAITIIAFIGMYYVESYFCTNFLSILANPNSNEPTDTYWWPFFLGLTLFTAIYSLFGGMRRVVLTDRWQISFAYISMGIVFSYLISRAFLSSPLTAIAVLFLTVLLFSALLVVNSVSQNRLIVQVSITAALIILIVSGFLSFRAPVQFSFAAIDIPGAFKQVSEPWGFVTLGGFLLLNVLWQFCDSSNFQRLASLNLDDNDGRSSKILARLYRRLIVVSPLTWGFGIMLGIAIRAAGVVAPERGTEYIALLTTLKAAALSGDPLALTALLALSAALTSIMMETVDSALIAGAQSFLRDVVRTRVFLNRYVFGIVVSSYILVIAFAIIHKSDEGLSILTVLAGAYSALVVLAVPTIMRLKGRSASDGVVILSILSGFILTWIATFGPIETLPMNVQSVLPLFAGPIGSVLPLPLSMALRRT